MRRVVAPRSQHGTSHPHATFRAIHQSGRNSDVPGDGEARVDGERSVRDGGETRGRGRHEEAHNEQVGLVRNSTIVRERATMTKEQMVTAVKEPERQTQKHQSVVLHQSGTLEKSHLEELRNDTGIWHLHSCPLRGIRELRVDKHEEHSY
ncbi:hypothetical protein DPEC_G00102560 [Dallia pectoralis]|uniref:Uncharacterized protein n=1 Tax=Dallia pectoralis TaxID=75939 RepID=A0ACC2GX50_DALPE|nr:hypothetical protein DPEC_G00102560 [Dallia pectoralis]